jgi:Fibronectin type III domain
MSIYPPTPGNRAPAVMIPIFQSTILTSTQSALLPNTPQTVALAEGSGTDLVVTWTAPTADSTHGAATWFNLQSSPSGGDTWNTVASVTSPHLLPGLPAGAAIDVQVQSANSAGTSPWSTTTTLTTAAAIPNAPAAPSLAQGPGSDLTVNWAPPTVDSTHSAATAFNLQSSPSGFNLWTTVSNVASPYDLSGLGSGTAVDVRVQSANVGGMSAWSATSTLTTASGPFAPNAPSITAVAPPPDGTNAKLTVTWTAPATDDNHSAATGYNLRYRPSGAGTWTTMPGVAGPYVITGLTGGAALDVEVQATNAASSPGAWSTIATGTTWGATVAPATWTAAATQVHSTSVAPNGGVNMIATAAPTAVTSAAFAWSVSPSIRPTTNPIAANPDGQTNGWGAYFTAPATPGTYYLWLLAQGSGGVTIGALVSSAITVS